MQTTEDRTFAAGSLIIPMDLSYQSSGMFQAYGLLFELLRQGVPVSWVIEPAKTWHEAPCDTAGDECAWDCAEEGSGVKCTYPTASPDFFASTQVVWDDQNATAPGTAIQNHGHRGGPFVIDAADRDAALPIIDVWNDPSQWAANPWADRVVFEVVTVHEATAPFTGHIKKQMLAAPTIAVFRRRPPGLLPDHEHALGRLRTRKGRVQGMDCCLPGYPGRVRRGPVYLSRPRGFFAEVRSFLKYPVHFFAECQAVNAYENTVPNSAWPYLDDAGRNGHFLTTTGTPPPCPCNPGPDEGDFECVIDGCGQGMDCCLPKNDTDAVADRSGAARLALSPAPPVSRRAESSRSL